ncbi:MAG: ankyrin repeat domain-containing protein, partial [Sphingomicrobium sp.]
GSGMIDKKWKLAACIAVALSAPAIAQTGGFDGLNFVKAVRDNDADKALPLLTSRAGVVNATDTNGDTALTVAIARNDNMWTLFLLDRGADPDMRGHNGDTPLIAAARVGYLEAAEQLLVRNAKVDLPNGKGETALMVAVQQRRRDIVKLLLEQGANPDKTDNVAGLSARDYAKRDTRSREILGLIESSKTRAPKVPKVEKLEDFKLK